MTELLRQAFAALEQLPAIEQDAVAQHILQDLLGEARWDASFADPRSEQFFATMVLQGEEEAKQGHLRPAPTKQSE